MNIQAMMKQAQKLQNDMMTEKNKIDNKEFVGKSSFVTVKKEVVDPEDVEMLEDLIMVAINDAMKQIDNEVEQNLGKYTKGMPGLF